LQPGDDLRSVNPSVTLGQRVLVIEHRKEVAAGDALHHEEQIADSDERKEESRDELRTDGKWDVPLRKNSVAFVLSADAGKFSVVRTRKRDSEVGDRTGAANAVTNSARVDFVITQVLPKDQAKFRDDVTRIRRRDQMAPCYLLLSFILFVVEWFLLTIINGVHEMRPIPSVAAANLYVSHGTGNSGVTRLIERKPC
jgi:hypothetical protein